MGNKWFTSDLHFGDPRIKLRHRDLITANNDEIDQLVIDNWNKTIKSDDTVFVLGDVCYDSSRIDILNTLNGRKVLVKGNYDDSTPDETWLKYFEKVCSSCYTHIGDEKVYLNHYPCNSKPEIFNIVGHIHDLWKVQRNMINVSVDAWHFMPVSEDRIAFTMNAIRNHYDQNVFAGEISANLNNKPVE